MTTRERAEAVRSAAAEIDAAIVAKGGTTAGGLRNAAAAIAALPSGGGGDGDDVWPRPWQNDGKTHVWWYFSEICSNKTAQFTLNPTSSSNTFKVDWGDGTVDTFSTSTSSVYHTYAESGVKHATVYDYDDIGFYYNFVFGAEGTGIVLFDRAPFSGVCARQLEIGTSSLIAMPERFRANGAIGLVAFKANITSISYDGFRFTNLNTIHGVENCKAIPDYAFDGLSKLDRIDGFGSFESIGDYAFRESGLQTIGDISSATSIGSWAFYKCRDLVSVGDIPLLTNGNARVFGGCYSLESVGNLSSLTSLGAFFFGSDSSLKSVGDMSSLSSIGDRPFYDCNSIESLTFSQKTHTEVMAISGFSDFPDRGRACVFHCSDGDFYRSGNNLLPIA